MAKNKANKLNAGFFMGILGNVIAWGILIAYFVYYIYYNGGSKIGTNKYLTFIDVSKVSMIVFAVYIVLYFSLWGTTKKEFMAWKPIWLMDIAIFSVAASFSLSYLLSPYKVGDNNKIEGVAWFKEGAFYGTYSWFMGLSVFLIFCGLYYAISRLLKYNKFVWIPVLVPTALVYVWAILNRFGIYPIKTYYNTEVFLASVGNMNWLAGFAAVVTPIFVGLYWGEKHYVIRKLFLAGAIIAMAETVLNGSDSGVLSLAIVLLVLLLVSFKDSVRMERFFNIVAGFFATCLAFGIVDIVFKGKRNYTSTLSDILLNWKLSLTGLIVALLIAIYFHRVNERIFKYPEGIAKNGAKIIGILAAAVVVLFALSVIINTLSGGKLLGTGTVFFFNDDWASARGGTWRLGVLTFLSEGFPRVLIGAGPDCMFFRIARVKELDDICYSLYNGSRLTNAHNEIITLLANVGIIGTGAYVFTVVTAIKNSFKAVKDDPTMVAFALSIIGFCANNIFSFQTVENTPFVFIVMGIGSAALKRLEERK